MRTFVGRRLERNDISFRFGRAIDLNDMPTLQQFFDIKVGTGELAWVLDQSAAIVDVFASDHNFAFRSRDRFDRAIRSETARR